MQIAISGVPWSIENVPQHLALECLDHIDILCLFSTFSELKAIYPDWFQYLVIDVHRFCFVLTIVSNEIGLYDLGAFLVFES